MNKYKLPKRFRDWKTTFYPKSFEIFHSGKYTKQLFIKDLTAGIIVGVVALPLAIAFGIASGVSPQQGLITAIVAGFIISFLGGSNVQIGGPTGAFIVIVSGILANYGISGLMIATCIAGVFLIIMGFLKFGDVIKFMPYPIIVGFTSGIAVMIFSTQIKDFFGLTNFDGSRLVIPSEFVDKWICYIKHITTMNPWATGVAVFTVLTGIFWQKVTKIIPGSLIAIIICSIISVVLRHYNIHIDTIGNVYPELSGGTALPAPEVPPINMKAFRELLTPAFTIAMLGAIESLLSAMVADGVTGKKHNSNTELIGQGIANIVSPIFGGIPATGAITRTMTNINNGGKTPVAGMFHALFLFLIYIFLMPLASNIPFACLAGVLVLIAYNMFQLRVVKGLMRNPKSDVIVFFVTFFLTMFFDLTIAIEVGILIAGILFIKRVMETSHIKVIQDEITRSEDPESDSIVEKLSKEIEVYEIDGPFFFGIANKFDQISSEIKSKKPKVRIIRMRKVPFIDSTGLQNLTALCQKSKKEKIQIILSGVTPEVYNVLEHSGFVDKLGKEFIFSHISLALEKANEIVLSLKS
ncbi:MAG: STAS domain-containing protein [Bacteroidales bacterium]|jgi:SulP family sulfate permease|nr:STAS domain-containing protein [Bacteroidales bacterium]